MALRDAPVLLAEEQRGRQRRFRFGLCRIYTFGGAVCALQRRGVDSREVYVGEGLSEGPGLLTK